MKLAICALLGVLLGVVPGFVLGYAGMVLYVKGSRGYELSRLAFWLSLALLISWALWGMGHSLRLLFAACLTG